MLKAIKDKVKEEIVAIEWRVNATTKRAEDAKVALQRAMKENYRLKGIQEAQSKKIKEVKAKVMMAEEKIKEAESSIKDKVKAAAIKAMKSFRASKELHGEKANFVSDTYDTEKQIIQDKVATRYPELNLDFLDEDTVQRS